MLARIIILISILGLSSGCYEDFDNTTSEDFPAPPATIINTKVSGSVRTATGEVLSDYAVEWSTGSKVVDGQHFLVDLQQVNQIDQTIWVRKDNQIISVGQYPLVENDINSVLFSTFSESVQKSLGSEVMIGDRLAISGAAGSGSFHYRSIIEGSAAVSSGWSENGKLQSLSDVSIYEIDLPAGVEADLTATANLRIFSYEPDAGQWIESSAKAVSGLGYYAVASATDGVIAKGQLLHETKAVSYAYYNLQSNRVSKSTANGNWLQVIPSESDVEVQLLNPCLEEINTQVIATASLPLSIDLILGPEAFVQSIETQIIDCEGELVQEAGIQISDPSGEQQLYFFGASDIQTNIPVCGFEFSIAAYDASTDQPGLDFPWSANVADEVTYLNTCEDFQNGYSLYQIRSDKRMYDAFTYVNDGGTITLTSDDGNIKLVIGGDQRGQYDVEMINIKIYDPGFGAQGYAVNCESSDFGCGIEDCHVSHIGETDNWVRVTFAGNVWMQTVSPLTAGTYPVRGIIICKAQ